MTALSESGARFQRARCVNTVIARWKRVVRIVLAMIGLCLIAEGCTMTPVPVARGQGMGPLGRRCSDCTPPWVPAWKYNSHVDDLVVYETAKCCGKRAFGSYRHQCPQAYSKDFAAGFVQAYIDLAEGRGPLPPTVPPSRYWTAYYRSCAGRPRVEDWYAGYQAGLEQGRQSGVSQFNRIDVHLAGCP